MALTVWEKMRQTSAADIGLMLRLAVYRRLRRDRMAVEREAIGRLAGDPAHEAGR